MKEFIKGCFIASCFSIILFSLLKVNNIDNKISESERYNIENEDNIVLIDTIQVHNKTHEIIRYYQGCIMHSPECWCNDKKIYE